MYTNGNSKTGVQKSNGTNHEQIEHKDALERILIEHFQFLPIHFIDEVINSVNSRMYQALCTLQDFLNGFIRDQTSVALVMNEIDTLIEGVTDKKFDVFELYSLQNIFSLLPNEPVPSLHYSGLNLSASEQDEIALYEEILKERIEIIKRKYLNRRLNSVLSKNQKYKEHLKKYVENSKDFYQLITNETNSSAFNSLEYIIPQFKTLLHDYEKSTKIFRHNYEARPNLRDLYIQRSLLSSMASVIENSTSENWNTQDECFEFDRNWDDIEFVLGQ